MASQTLRTLKLSLLADVSDFGANLDKAGNSFRDFSRTVERASGFATVAIGAIGGIAASAINAASDLSETSSAVEQVFGPRSARQLQSFAREAARSLGQSRQQALEAAQTFGIFGQSAGLADDDLVDFTTTLVSLAADLASFNNTTVDQAITALGAALRGESEPIRNYGVLLDAATLKNQALADGLIETTEEALDPATRVLAAYSAILEQTSLQQGDFERTSDGLANKQRTLQAEFENFRVELGEQLLPVVDELLPKVEGFFDTFLETDPEVIVAAGEAILKLSVAIVALNGALKAFAALQGAYKALTTPLGAFAAVLVGAGAATAYTAENLPPGYIGPSVPGLPGLDAERLARAAAAAPAGQRRTGNVMGRGGGSATVVVNGIVGSPYQVFREIERAQQLGTRSGIGSSAQVR
jgi:hypothetical protein